MPAVVLQLAGEPRPHERRLPAAGRSHDDELALVQPGGGSRPRRPGEALGVLDVVGDQPWHGHVSLTTRRDSSDRDGSWRRMAALERHQIRARIERQLLGEAARASRRVRSASAWLPERYWASANSSHRRSRNACSLTEATAPTVPPRARRCAADVQPELLRVQPECGQPLRLDLPCIPVDQVGKCGAPPQRERLVQGVLGAVDLTRAINSRPRATTRSNRLASRSSRSTANR